LSVLDPTRARLERRVADRPEDAAAHLELARLLRRLGDRVGAFATLDAYLDRAPSAEAEALQAQVLASGRLRTAFEPVALASPDTGKPRTRHSITALAVDPAETHLAVGKGSGDVYLVPLRGGDPRYLGRCGKKKSARAATFAPDGAAFFTGDATGTVRRWDVASGEMTRASKKLDNILEAVAVWRGGIATASIRKRFRIAPGGAVQEENSWMRAVARTTAASPGPEDPLEDLVREARGGVAADRSLYSAYWDEFSVVDLAGSAAGLLKEGSFQVHRDGAWSRYEDPRLVNRHVHSLAPGGRALAIGQFIRVIQNHPTDPPSRGLRLCFLGEELAVTDLMEDAYVSCVAFSPSGGLVAVGTETGHLFVVPLFVDEARGAGEASEAVAPQEPPWETRGTRSLRPGELTLLGRYGEGAGRGFGKVAGRVLGMSDDVVLLGTAEEDKVALGDTCLSLKSGTFEPTARHLSHRRFPPHRARNGRTTPAWLKVAGETARYWVETPEQRHAAALVRGDAAAILVGSTQGKGAPVRLEAGGPVARIAWSPRGRRLAVLRRDGVVEIYGSVSEP
jgi:hypothetical protein